MATISRSGIAASSTISATHITNIIDALDGSGSAVTIIATGSFSGSLTGIANLATKASTLSQGGGNNAAMTFNTTLPGGQPTYVWGTNNGTDVYIYNPSVFSVASASFATTASLVTKAMTVSQNGTSNGSPITFVTTVVGGQPTYVLGTSDGLTNVPLYNPSNFSVASASVATTATTATTATSASAVPFTGITNTPAAISYDGVSSVAANITGSTDSTKVLNGAFYPADATSGSFNITLKQMGTTTPLIGYEFTVFYKTGSFDVAFVADGSQTIISPNNYLKLNGTGSAAVAKYIAADTWALIGNLKA